MIRPVFVLLRWRRLRPLIALILALGLVAFASQQKAYAPGSGASFPLAGRTVVIDPGHGGIDPGCHWGDLTEKEITLSVALLLAGELQAQGASVYVTRSEDVELSPYGLTQRTRHGRDLEARVLLAQRFGGEILVSLHVNAGASERMGGGMVFYPKASEKGKLLAQSILEPLREVTPGNQNAALPADFYVLRHAPMPAVLVEMGFLTHRADRELLQSSAGRRRLAQAIARGIAGYFGGAPAVRWETPAEDDPVLNAAVSGFDGGGAHRCPLPSGSIADQAGGIRPSGGGERT